MGFFGLFGNENNVNSEVKLKKNEFGLVTIGTQEEVDAFAAGKGDFGDKEFDYAAQVDNLAAGYQYSVEELKAVAPNLNIEHLPWFLVVPEDSKTSVKEFNELLQNPLVSTGDIEEVYQFLKNQA
jgi:hypothetical protein